MLRTVYYAKTWFFYVSAIVVSMLGLFSAIMGPLFLFGLMKRADGTAATDAGVAMSIMAIPLSAAAMLGWFNVLARRKPLLRICSEGIEINVIGSSSLDGAPLIPPIIRVAWLVLSLQGFKKQIGWIPWTMLREVDVGGLPLVRTLIIQGTIVYPNFADDEISAKIGNAIEFGAAEFTDSLDEIAAAIRRFQVNPELRELLPSLHD